MDGIFPVVNNLFAFCRGGNTARFGQNKISGGNVPVTLCRQGQGRIKILIGNNGNAVGNGIEAIKLGAGCIRQPIVPFKRFAARE